MSETLLVNSNTVLRLRVLASPSTLKNTSSLFAFVFENVNRILFSLRGHKIPRRTRMMKIWRLIRDSCVRSTPLGTTLVKEKKKSQPVHIFFLTGVAHLGVCYLYEHSPNMWGRSAQCVSMLSWYFCLRSTVQNESTGLKGEFGIFWIFFGAASRMVVAAGASLLALIRSVYKRAVSGATRSRVWSLFS